MQNSNVDNYKGNYVRLIDYNTSEKKSENIFNKSISYKSTLNEYKKFPEIPFWYWASNQIKHIYNNAN